MILGLTGGIASGKSTVSNILKELGIKIVDADLMAKNISNRKNIKEEIALRLDKNLLNSNYEIDKEKLKRIVFKDKEKLEILNSIYHPKIKEEFKKIKENSNKDDIIIFDVPLLFETGINKYCDVVILVCVDEEIQIKRIMKRDGIDRDLAIKIIKSQMSQDKKRDKADIIINNNESLNKLKQETMKIIKDIIRRK